MEYIGPFPLVVSEAAAQNSGEVFNILDDDTGGIKTFSFQLSPNGQANATHLATYTYLRPDVENALRNMNVTDFKAFVDAEAVKKGRVAPNNVTAFKNSLQMGAQGENFYSFIESIGLKPVAVEAFKN